MLLPKQKETPYIHVFRFSTGEEIIAKVIEDKLGEFVISNPLQMVMGANGPHFAPLMIMNDPNKPFSINKSLIMANATPLASLENQYESATSGIALPPKQQIIT